MSERIVVGRGQYPLSEKGSPETHLQERLSHVNVMLSNVRGVPRDTAQHQQGRLEVEKLFLEASLAASKQ